ncbi:PREDICTED: transient receptor potential cation channel trpm-like [Priapulus caudatus]|uniref:Transient receptor potential cation channel trpm-like n=1 Tax=Priapulus caudatus TaxID=37621 RepID=A0ABM1EHW3_PRICU|nr:PREDICTED: transient receptor potential cation channel trpm-like [Priapulus caudatus]
MANDATMTSIPEEAEPASGVRIRSLPLLRSVVGRLLGGHYSDATLGDDGTASSSSATHQHRVNFKPYIIAARFCGNYASACTCFVLQAQRPWIEKHFTKRECIHYLPSGKDMERCGCGRTCAKHAYLGYSPEPGLVGRHTGQSNDLASPSTAYYRSQWPCPRKRFLFNGRDEHWNFSKHSAQMKTDAFGMVEFQGGPQTDKAQYIRLSVDTRSELIVQLLTQQWGLELPKLVISIHGGIPNFELQPKLKRMFRKGLLKAAKTTGSWIITGGTNTGVNRQVGQALGDHLSVSKMKKKIVSIGIAPWGMIEHREDLIGRDVVRPYYSIQSPKSRYALLNSKHSHFLLADSGTGGKFGAEIILRKKLEKYISQQKIQTRAGGESCGVPVVCVVLEGGPNTIRTALEYVTDTPPVPVVVCDGSGRAADIIAFAHKFSADDGGMISNLSEQLVITIEKTFHYSKEQAERLYSELMQCMRKKELITIFRMGEGNMQDIDQAILTALLKIMKTSAVDQLNLALTWNRVDIARSEIFVYGQEWPEGALEQAMMEALASDRVDFVNLLLENGVNMQKFLTIPRLEELYNVKCGPANTLYYLVSDFKKHMPFHYTYTLIDIGLVIEALMSGAYRSTYTRRKFRSIYNIVMKRCDRLKTPNRANIANHLTNVYSSAFLPGISVTSAPEAHVFLNPFHELFIWAVLTKRQKMALFLWRQGEEAMAKALVACKLYKALAHEAAQDDLEVDVCEELREYAREFSRLALDLLDQCYKQDDDFTQQLLTYELLNWSNQTCLSLAYTANHREFVAHTCCQLLLTEMWMGGLRMRKSTTLKVVLGLLMPPTILMLEFKTREELQLMPQTEEEHLELEEDSTSSEASSQNPEDLMDEEGVISEKTVLSSVATPETSAHDECRFSETLTEKKPTPLRLGKKVHEFYTSPITKFWMYTFAYLIFMVMFNYTVLVRMEPDPSWLEYYVMAYVWTLSLEKIREIIQSEPTNFAQKIRVWLISKWNIFDCLAVVLFTIGVGLRVDPSTHTTGRVIYCLNVGFWYIRILDIFNINKYLGPYVTMIGKMVVDMCVFVVIMCVVLMSFGVVRQAIRYPDSPPSWTLARDVFYQPYWMIYGEVFAGDINPECGEEGTLGEDGRPLPSCVPGQWIVPAVMATYLLVTNVLLVNLLIARFNSTFTKVNAVAQQVWKFQRYSVILEYEQRPVLAPPLIILCHMYQLVKYCNRRYKGQKTAFDCSLKLFLDEEDVEKVHDFEEECLEDLFRERAMSQLNSQEERIGLINERVENMSARVLDMGNREGSIKLTMQTIDYRLSKLEELSMTTNNSLACIHRFMNTYMTERISACTSPVLLDHDRTVEDEERFRYAADVVAAASDGAFNAKQTLEEDGARWAAQEEPAEKPTLTATWSSGSDLAASGKTPTPLRQSMPSGGGGLRRSVSARSRSAIAGAPYLDVPARRGPGRPSLLQRRLARQQPADGEQESPPHADLLELSVTIPTAAAAAAAGGATPAAMVRADSLGARAQTPFNVNVTTLLSQLRHDYTSITDNIDTSCLLTIVGSPESPPASPSLDAPTTETVGGPASAGGNAAAEVLRDAEERDYRILEGLIQRRIHRDSENLSASLDDVRSVSAVSDITELNEDAAAAGSDDDGVAFDFGTVDLEFGLLQFHQQGGNTVNSRPPAGMLMHQASLQSTTDTVVDSRDRVDSGASSGERQRLRTDDLQNVGGVSAEGQRSCADDLQTSGGAGQRSCIDDHQTSGSAGQRLGAAGERSDTRAQLPRLLASVWEQGVLASSLSAPSVMMPGPGEDDKHGAVPPIARQRRDTAPRVKFAPDLDSEAPCEAKETSC